MSKTTFDRLSAALDDPDIPQAARFRVLHKVCGREPIPAAIDLDWKALLAAVRHARYSVVSNRATWKPETAELHQLYVDIMSSVIKKVEAAMVKLKPDGTPHTVRSFSAHQRKVNAERISAGQKPLGDCNAQWPSWVPPHIRHDLYQRFDTAYTQSGRTKGNRLTPFAPKALKAHAMGRIAKLRLVFASHRRVHSMYPDRDLGATAASALFLAGTRMAEIALNRLETGIKSGRLHPFENPVPVNWTHLCDHAMRERLRAAAANPHSIMLVDDLLYYYSAEAAQVLEHQKRALPSVTDYELPDDTTQGDDDDTDA
ncbi:hypothetical protein UFOVP228_52 [uncultured Caudovirales phage]|uniref:Uncharacterized protein n=1 Tax=uncultured Caudovirales phage TaxID=2100421 RepID=A0A6J5T8D4_9CAUD|nr:hypothetical protein UFOVP47_50 [uncultured Caudovirales phage]CAB5219304.1 hypothetical protein UFOVP228_52 [uncultured Caudovirales phage]